MSMDITPVGYRGIYGVRPPDVGLGVVQHAVSQAQTISKEDMRRLLELMTYNQFGMAEKLAKTAAEMYAGMNFDYLG